MEDERQFANHLKDLANKAYNQNIFTFTGFCGLMETDIYERQKKDLNFVKSCKFGGISDAERVVIRFGDEETFGYEEVFPITFIKITPLNAKFADKLTHRDVLGSLMNLQIKRETLGDILIEENEIYLVCLESIAAFILENLTTIKHTKVKLVQLDSAKNIPKMQGTITKIQISSMRLDAVISKVFNLSRSDSVEFFRAGKVFVEGRMIENNDRILKIGESVTLRGFGKFSVLSEPETTRKGKLSVSVEVFS